MNESYTKVHEPGGIDAIAIRTVWKRVLVKEDLERRFTNPNKSDRNPVGVCICVYALVDN